MDNYRRTQIKDIDGELLSIPDYIKKLVKREVAKQIKEIIDSKKNTLENGHNAKWVD